MMDGGDCPGPHCARMLNTSNSAGVCWTMMAISVGIPQDVALPNPDDWIPYAAQYATLPPIPAHLALPAPVWSFLSSVVLLYLQPTLLSALAITWPGPQLQNLPSPTPSTFPATALAPTLPLPLKQSTGCALAVPWLRHPRSLGAPYHLPAGAAATAFLCR